MKLLALSQGKFAMIDDEDFERATKEEALEAYRVAAQKHFGEFANV